MKDFFANLMEVWEDLDLIEKTGIIVLSLVVLGFVALCIMWPVLLLITLIFAAGAGVIVFAIIGVATLIDRI